MPLGAAMRRRKFIIGVAGAVALPWVARAQEKISWLEGTEPGICDALTRFAESRHEVVQVLSVLSH